MAFDADPFAGLSEKTASICRYLAMGWRVSEIRNEFGYTQAMVSGIKRRHAERISRQQEELSRDTAFISRRFGVRGTKWTPSQSAKRKCLVLKKKGRPKPPKSLNLPKKR